MKKLNLDFDHFFATFLVVGKHLEIIGVNTPNMYGFLTIQKNTKDSDVIFTQANSYEGAIISKGKLNYKIKQNIEFLLSNNYAWLIEYKSEPWGENEVQSPLIINE
jgi:hypothetical protein